MMHADHLTIAFGAADEQRTFTDVHYTLTWNRVIIVHNETGHVEEIDKADVIGTLAYRAAKAA